MIQYSRCLFVLGSLAHACLLIVALELLYLGLTTPFVAIQEESMDFVPVVIRSSWYEKASNSSDASNTTTVDDDHTSGNEYDDGMVPIRPFVFLSAGLLLIQVAVSSLLLLPLHQTMSHAEAATLLLLKNVRIAMMSLLLTGLLVTVVGTSFVAIPEGRSMVVLGSAVLLLALAASLLAHLPDLDTARSEEDDGNHDMLREPLLQPLEQDDDDEEAAATLSVARPAGTAAPGSNGTSRMTLSSTPQTPTTRRTPTGRPASALKRTPAQEDTAMSAAASNRNNGNGTSPVSAMTPPKASTTASAAKKVSIDIDSPKATSGPEKTPQVNNAASPAASTSNNGKTTPLATTPPKVAAAMASPAKKISVSTALPSVSSDNTSPSATPVSTPQKTAPTDTPSSSSTPTATTLTSPRNGSGRRTQRVVVPAESPRASTTTSLHEKTWAVRFAELQKYYDEHGDIRVPEHYYKYPQLHRWMERQQVQYRAFVERKPTTMTAERLEALQELGMTFQ